MAAWEHLGAQWKNVDIHPLTSEWADHLEDRSDRSPYRRHTAAKVVADSLWASPVGPQGPDLQQSLQNAMRDLMQPRRKTPRQGGQFDTRRVPRSDN